ncbi:MAG: translation initiation factor IF-3 [Candidatus Melainabacteria bacterium RIFOXYA2_FULL_32_9]|nr:MAG: translation initiation factor IF-3 [Candidatus Melainabacteria bacterium RIFOXYA2_FULL_32_9]
MLISNVRFQSSKPTGILNEDIRTKEVRLIDDEGNNLGIVNTRDALNMAYDKELDLVIISPNQTPPVAKILDYGKYKFESEKKAKEAKKKQHVVEVKEVKMRYKIDTHDYDVRIKNIKKFLKAGNKVKVMIMLRGREIQHSKLAFDLAERIKNDLQDINYTMEKQAGLEGKNVVMILTTTES